MIKYDYKELKAFLLPEHKWLYFSIRAFRTSGWLYFVIGAGVPIANFCSSDQPKGAWAITGALFFSLVQGCVSLKAYRSQGPNGEQKEEPIIATNPQ